MPERSPAREQYLRDLVASPSPEEAAECNARGMTLPALRAERRHHTPAPDPDQLEEAERVEIIRIYRAHGCKVCNLSQPRHAKYLTPGMPDLYIVRRPSREAWWHEAKRPVGGRYSPAQIEFRDDMAACSVGWVGGDRQAAIAKLRGLGVRVDL